MSNLFEIAKRSKKKERSCTQIVTFGLTEIGKNEIMKRSTKMTRLKKITFVIAVVMLVGFLFGCSPGQTGPSETKDSPGTPSSPDNGPVETEKKQYKAACIFNVSDPYNGGGYERMMLEGCDAVREELGWQVDVAEGVEFTKIFEVAAGYASAGYDMIFFPGGEFYDAWMQLADEYPDTWGIMMSLVQDLPESGNACAIQPDKFGYGLVVGSVMSMLSETGTVGVVGGMPVGGVLAEFSGIIEGVKITDPPAEVIFGWTGEYEDIANHNETTRLLIEQGADVIFTATGPGYKGVWEAASKGNAKVIGYGYDSYVIDPDVVTGSVAYDGRLQFLRFAKALEDGTIERGFYPFGHEIVNISDFRGSISDELDKKIRDFCQKIFDGEIVVEPVDHNFS